MQYWQLQCARLARIINPTPYHSYIASYQTIVLSKGSGILGFDVLFNPGLIYFKIRINIRN